MEKAKDTTSPKRARKKSSLLWKLLLAFVALSVLPMSGVEWFIQAQLQKLRELADHTARTYEMTAADVADSVSNLLHSCEKDLDELARTPRSQKAYVKFADNHKLKVWIRDGTNERMLDQVVDAPKYKELSFIDSSGKEKILVVRGSPMPEEKLRDVSKPENTTYKCEKYFNEAFKKPGTIYVSHLNGFHVNRVQQLGIDKIIQGLKNTSAEKKRIYRYLLYEMLRAAGAVKYVGDFHEGEGHMLVYKEIGEKSRILVEDPGHITSEQLQARELELRELIKKIAPEDVVEGQRYDGVIRFAKSVTDENGKLIGVVSLALDHMHLMQFTQHIKAMEKKATVFAGYRDADYTYLFDDQGWIITHPKLWNIRGVDHTGKPVPALTEKTTAVQSLVGQRAVNLQYLDWKMGQGYHAVVLETRKGHTGIATTNNLAGVLRTRVYSPIFYHTGPYARYGIFGGVMLGTRVDKFIELLRQMNSRIGQKITQMRRSIFWPLLTAVAILFVLAIFISRGIMRPVRALSEAARKIGSGRLDTHVPVSGTDEIGDLAQSFSDMTKSLKETIKQLEVRNRELKNAQRQLIEAQKAKQRKLEQELAQLQKEIERASFANMVAVSEEMKQVQQEIVRVAESTATVLILGDNGTGKELVAEAIHRNSPRRDREFVKVNCAAFDDNLLASELFGHVKGAFTGATGVRKGLFVTADGGTLLLDEVGDMSLEMQKMLLRTLQEGEVVPLGSSKVTKVDVRIIASTNQDLLRCIKNGSFREDLYHRLNVISIRVPALKDRKDDILPLARFFLAKFADKEDKPITRISPDAEQFLLGYSWPGNVRELENAVERAVIRSRDTELRLDDFQLTEQEQDAPIIKDALSRHMTLAEVERAYILEVLRHNDGNKKATASQLGIGYNTLWRKLKKYDA